MNEKEKETGKNRREWVKTAAIIFLSVMLLLTFFSSTIMNYSLPEVSAQYIQSGTITEKVRGTGVIESADSYQILVKESRKVQSVAVKVGDQVAKDDVLLYLEDTESEELLAAKEALEQAEDAYDLAILSAEVSQEVLQEAGGQTSTRTYRQQITDAQQDVKIEQKKVDSWQQKFDAIQTKIANVPGNTADATSEKRAMNNAQQVKQSKEFDHTAAQNQVNQLQGQLDALAVKMEEISVSEGSATWESLDKQRKQIQQKLWDAQDALFSAQAAFDAAELDYAKAESAYQNKVASGDTTGTLAALQDEQKAIEAGLNAATQKLEEKQGELTKLASKINGVLGLQNQYEAITKAQEEVDKQMENAVNAVVRAEVSGTVTTLNVQAGETTAPDVPVAVLQPQGKGYTMSFTASNEQSKRLTVGNKAELVNAWRYQDVQVTLSSIQADPQNPGQQKILSFDVTGEVTPGQSISLSVGQKSANYDLILPNSAIREDNNGKFVLTVVAKSSPLRTRYVATRVDVEVLASDDTQSAVSGNLYNWDYVIVNASKPVEAGKLVRLAQSSL